jgi:ABC-type histidine transport system ATPase subunit
MERAMKPILIVGSYLSPYVRKVLACLEVKGMAYEVDHIVPFFGDDRFSKLSPLRRIPVLVDGDLVLSDSSAICQYLEDKQPDPALFPKDIADRARARWLEEFADTRMGDVFIWRLFNQIAIRPSVWGEKGDREMVERTLTEEIPTVLDYLEGEAPEISRLRTKLGMVFQSFNLWSHMTVLENVIEGPVQVLRRPKSEASDEAMAILAKVGIAEKHDAYPNQLSGGQQQRVAIARALAVRPELVLFDEPTSALDPRMTAEVLSVMNDLAREGQTMLVVTHAMSFARRVAHQMHVVAAGVIIESGPPQQIFDAPQHAATRELLQEDDS